MFTGLIEEVGRLRARKGQSYGVRLTISAELSKDLTLGASVNVQGACQTVVAAGKDWFEVEAVGVTLEKSTLGDATVGASLNLERALTIDRRLDGHLVTGHVQGTGKIRSFSPRGDAWILDIEVPQQLRRFVLPEGSIAIDGISLTIAAATSWGAVLSVIPHTRGATTLASAKPGTRINLETDASVRAAFAAGSDSGLSWEDLKTWGYT